MIGLASTRQRKDLPPAAVLLRGVRPLAADKRGAALIEFAIVITPFIALIIASVQVSLTFFAQQTLETVAEKSVRQLMTGAAQKAGMTKAQFKTAVCNNLPGLLKCANTMVDVQTATSFSSVNTAAPTITYNAAGQPNNSWAWNPGSPGQITVVKIMYVWNVQSGPLGFDISTLSPGKRLLITTSVFKTEPYPS